MWNWTRVTITAWSCEFDHFSGLNKATQKLKIQGHLKLHRTTLQNDLIRVARGWNKMEEFRKIIQRSDLPTSYRERERERERGG